MQSQQKKFDWPLEIAASAGASTDVAVSPSIFVACGAFKGIN
ncbi:hypothetical protein [Microcoleus sp. B7-D4]